MITGRVLTVQVVAFCMGRGPLCQRPLNLLQFLAVLLMPIAPKRQQQAAQSPAQATSTSDKAQQQPYGNPSHQQPDVQAHHSHHAASSQHRHAASTGSSNCSDKPPVPARRRSPRCSASSVHEQPGNSRAARQQHAHSLPLALHEADPSNLCPPGIDASGTGAGETGSSSTASASSNSSSPQRPSTVSTSSSDDDVATAGSIASSSNGAGTPVPLARAPSAPAAVMQARMKVSEPSPADVQAQHGAGAQQAVGISTQPMQQRAASPSADAGSQSSSSGSSSSSSSGDSEPEAGFEGTAYLASSAPSALVAEAAQELQHAVQEVAATAGEPTASRCMLPQQPQACRQCDQPQQGAGSEQCQCRPEQQEEGETMEQARQRLCAALLLMSVLITALHMRPQWVPDVLQHAGERAPAWATQGAGVSAGPPCAVLFCCASGLDRAPDTC
jgi:hypothetical protein